MTRSTMLAAAMLALAPAAAQATTTITGTGCPADVNQACRAHTGGQLTYTASTDVAGAAFQWLDQNDNVLATTQTFSPGPFGGNGVQLRVKAIGGVTEQAQRFVSVQQAPTPVVQQVQSGQQFVAACPGRDVQLAAQLNGAAFDPSTARLRWDLDGDGTFEVADQQTALTRTFKGQRQKQAKVEATWPDGTVSVGTFSFGVPAPTVPNGALQAFKRSGLRREPLTFSSSVGGQCPLSYEFVWGDGTTTKLDGPQNGQFAPVQTTHAFPDVETAYDVHVRVDDGAGAVASPSIQITTQPNRPPTGKVSASRPDVLLGESVTLEASSLADVDGDIKAIEWDLDGNGFFDDAKGASVTFTPATGGVQPKLRITDDLGGTQVLTVPTTVFGAPSLAPSLRNGVVTGSYFDARGGSLTNDRRIDMRQTGKVDDVRFVFPVLVQGLRGAKGQIVVPGKLARRLGLSADGSDLVLAEADGTSPTAIAGSLSLSFAATDAAKRLFARVRRLPVSLVLSGTDGFGQPVSSTTGIVLEEDKGAVTRPGTTTGRPGGRPGGRAAMRLRFGRMSRTVSLRPAAARQARARR